MEEYFYHLPTGVTFNNSKTPFHTGTLAWNTVGQYQITALGFIQINGASSSVISVVPYDATKYRIWIVNPSNNFISNGYYAHQTARNFQFSFQFLN